MGTIRVNLDAVLAQSHDIANAKRTVTEVKSSIDSLYHQIDSKILARNSIGSRLRNTSSQLGGIQNQLGRIRSTVENGVNSYFTVERKASKGAMDISGADIVQKHTYISSIPTLNPGESLKDYLKRIGNAFRLGDEIMSNGKVAFLSSVWTLASHIAKVRFDSGAAVDLHEVGSGIISSSFDAYSAFFEHLTKGECGPELERKFGESVACVALFGNAITFGLSGVEASRTYNEWKNGRASGYDFSSSVIDTAGEGVQFAGSAVMFQNWLTPGQIEILPNGKLSSGMVKNTEFLKGAAYLSIADAGTTFASEFVSSYGEYSADGYVDMGEWGNIGVQSSLHALNKLNPVGFLISDQVIDSAADCLTEDFGKAAADNLSQYDWYWDYANFDGNTLTNNVVTRGVAGVGATAVAMGETVYEGINSAFDAVSEAAADAAKLAVDGIAGLFK